MSEINKHIALAEYFYQLSKQIPIESEQHEQIKILLSELLPPGGGSFLGCPSA